MKKLPHLPLCFSALFRESLEASEGGHFVKFLLKREFALLDYGEFAVIYPKGFFNKFRVFIARLILPQAVGVLILKRHREENLLPPTQGWAISQRRADDE